MKRRRLMAVFVMLALVFNQGIAMAVVMPAMDSTATEMSPHCATSTDATETDESSSTGSCCADGVCNCVAHAAVIRIPVMPTSLRRSFACVSHSVIRLHAHAPDDPLRPPID